MAGLFESEDVFGARLQLALPVDGLRVGGSFYSGRPDLPDDPIRSWTWGVQGEYVVDRTWIRAEFVKQKDRLPPTDDRETAYYVEVAQFLTDHIQVAGLVSSLEADITIRNSPPAPEDLSRTKEYALGLNYWVSPEFGIKASMHWADGNLLAELQPDEYEPAVLFGRSPRPKTRLFQFGAQFSF